MVVLRGMNREVMPAAAAAALFMEQSEAIAIQGR